MESNDHSLMIPLLEKGKVISREILQNPLADSNPLSDIKDWKLLFAVFRDLFLNAHPSKALYIRRLYVSSSCDMPSPFRAILEESCQDMLSRAYV